MIVSGLSELFLCNGAWPLVVPPTIDLLGPIVNWGPDFCNRITGFCETPPLVDNWWGNDMIQVRAIPVKIP
jgi:uncharacterized membrane protein YdfJ with MMPL/SSD domain